jgi:hypothetical protein
MLRLLAAFAAVSLAGLSFADDKKADDKAPTLSGKWVRDTDDFKLEFGFEKDKLTIVVLSGENGLTVTLDYKVDKDGKVTAEVTDVKEKGAFPTKPEKGSKLTFTFKAGDKTAKITDFEAPEGDGAKAIVEGEYKKKVD